MGRLLVEGDLEGQEIVTYAVLDSLLPADATDSGSGDASATEQTGRTQAQAQGMGLRGWAALAATAVHVDGDVMVQQATWSPAGSLLAFTEMRADGWQLLESRVVVADGRTGHLLGSWVLSTPMPPFYYMWAACGTRLLFLRCGAGGCWQGWLRRAACSDGGCSACCSCARLALLAWLLGPLQGMPPSHLAAPVQQLGGRCGGAASSGHSARASAARCARCAGPGAPGAPVYRPPPLPRHQPRLHPPAVAW